MAMEKNENKITEGLKEIAATDANISILSELKIKVNQKTYGFRNLDTTKKSGGSDAKFVEKLLPKDSTAKKSLSDLDKISLALEGQQQKIAILLENQWDLLQPRLKSEQKYLEAKNPDYYDDTSESGLKKTIQSHFKRLKESKTTPDEKKQIIKDIKEKIMEVRIAILKNEHVLLKSRIEKIYLLQDFEKFKRNNPSYATYVQSEKFLSQKQNYIKINNIFTNLEDKETLVSKKENYLIRLETVMGDIKNKILEYEKDKQEELISSIHNSNNIKSEFWEKFEKIMKVITKFFFQSRLYSILFSKEENLTGSNNVEAQKEEMQQKSKPGIIPEGPQQTEVTTDYIEKEIQYTKELEKIEKTQREEAKELKEVTQGRVDMASEYGTESQSEHLAEVNKDRVLKIEANLTFAALSSQSTQALMDLDELIANRITQFGDLDSKEITMINELKDKIKSLIDITNAEKNSLKSEAFYKGCFKELELGDEEYEKFLKDPINYTCTVIDSEGKERQVRPEIAYLEKIEQEPDILKNEEFYKDCFGELGLGDEEYEKFLKDPTNYTCKVKDSKGKERQVRPEIAYLEKIEEDRDILKSEEFYKEFLKDKEYEKFLKDPINYTCTVIDSEGKERQVKPEIAYLEKIEQEPDILKNEEFYKDCFGELGLGDEEYEKFLKDPTNYTCTVKDSKGKERQVRPVIAYLEKIEEDRGILKSKKFYKEFLKNKEYEKFLKDPINYTCTVIDSQGKERQVRPEIAYLEKIEQEFTGHNAVTEGKEILKVMKEKTQSILDGIKDALGGVIKTENIVKKIIVEPKDNKDTLEEGKERKNTFEKITVKLESKDNSKKWKDLKSKAGIINNASSFFSSKSSKNLSQNEEPDLISKDNETNKPNIQGS